ncbi:right-handed parallel beta-helix repeat-containing protein [Aquihabitans sp. G128]|uniref:right-handed parallel beta-helix repeat-containing protein n=1 Tax=Aquihabitans sp. G128 TaxID=2849779 RepID=UPI001C2504D6|nr:right-handed parallel beta-helix repeat-containing protein [Aquihabitans sp. G128]QXC63009.1 right-handed parallel beta-helix repeat-containing protein [Aquihabitans sp. G128]
MRKSVFATAAVVLILAGACGADPDLRQLGGGATLAKATEVVALDNVFGDDGADIRIDVGGTVSWANDGRNDHNIVPVAKGADWGATAQRFRPGDHYSHAFPTEGVYEYYCSLHGSKTGGMKGRVLVGSVKAPPPVADPSVDVAAEASGGTVRVPADYPTIQKAVDAAQPGDLVLISPGTYREAVDVPETKPYLTIRGLDREKVVLDGGLKLANGFKIVKAKGVAIENLTAQNYTKNGFFWTGVEGYRGSYLTAVRNGDYGVYAFESTKGQFDHSYASGSPDAGFYIGGCQPCDALITDVTSEWNGLGYSGTNAGGNLVIANSTWRYNRAGIVPNSGSYEPNAPQDDNTIVGNLVYGNNNGKTPAIDISITAMGNGILVAGGINDTIERNRVYDHTLGGIVVITYPENDEYTWEATGNVVRGNVVSGSGLGDLAFFHDFDNAEGGDNCFEGNTFATSAPKDLEAVIPCTGKGTGNFKAGAFNVVKLAVNDGKPASVPYEKTVLPPVPPQPQMPKAATAPGKPAVGLPEKIDLAAITVPDAPR